jgi:hypothetical protein
VQFAHLALEALLHCFDCGPRAIQLLLQRLRMVIRRDLEQHRTSKLLQQRLDFRPVILRFVVSRCGAGGFQTAVHVAGIDARGGIGRKGGRDFRGPQRLSGAPRLPRRLLRFERRLHWAQICCDERKYAEKEH